MSTGITFHLMVRDEPLTYYAARSIYPIADRIILRDTGTTDSLSLRSIAELLAADKRAEKKIDAKVIRIPDERGYDMFSHASKRALQARTAGNLNKAVVRQRMLAETRTPFFFVVDGDEIYEEASLPAIAEAARSWPQGKIMGHVSYLRLCETRRCWSSAIVGRLFPTATTRLGNQTPGEKGWGRVGNKWVALHSGDMRRGFMIPRARFWHYSAVLKPWRVVHRPAETKRDLTLALPIVTRENAKLWKACCDRMEGYPRGG